MQLQKCFYNKFDNISPGSAVVDSGSSNSLSDLATVTKEAWLNEGSISGQPAKSPEPQPPYLREERGRESRNLNGWMSGKERS